MEGRKLLYYLLDYVCGETCRKRFWDWESKPICVRFFAINVEILYEGCCNSFRKKLGKTQISRYKKIHYFLGYYYFLMLIQFCLLSNHKWLHLFLSDHRSKQFERFDNFFRGRRNLFSDKLEDYRQSFIKLDVMCLQIV